MTEPLVSITMTVTRPSHFGPHQYYEPEKCSCEPCWTERAAKLSLARTWSLAMASYLRWPIVAAFAYAAVRAVFP